MPLNWQGILIDPNMALPIYAQLAQSLHHQISAGQLMPGDCLPGELELGQRLGISRTSVRQALAELRSLGAVESRHGSGHYVRPGQESELLDLDTSTAAQRSGDRKYLGLILPGLNNEIYPAIVSGVRENFFRAGFSLIVGNSHSSREREIALLRKMIALPIQGLLIEPCHARFEIPGSQVFQFLSELQIPCVLLNNDIQGLDLSRVVIDDVAGGKIATEALINLGHKRIAYIYKDSVLAAIERRAGYRSALVHAGISPDPSLERAFSEADEAQGPGEYITRQLLALPNPPSAFFYYNDELAIGAFRVFAAAGLSIPQDISVIAADNTASAHALYQLSSLEHPKQLIGRWAADIVLDQLSSGPAPIRRRLTIHPNLQIRNSIGACKK